MRHQPETGSSPNTAAPSFTVRRSVKWGDCDPAGIVYTPRFSDYVVDGHLSFFVHLFGTPTYQYFQPAGLALPAKAIGIEFKKSLRPDDPFDMRVRVAAIREHTYDLSVVGSTPEGTVSFVATLTLICVRIATGTAEPLPDIVRGTLETSMNGRSVVPSESAPQ